MFFSILNILRNISREEIQKRAVTDDYRSRGIKLYYIKMF